MYIPTKVYYIGIHINVSINHIWTMNGDDRGDDCICSCLGVGTKVCRHKKYKLVAWYSAWVESCR